MDIIIDGYATTVDWETAETTIAILPMGACEQHGSHLPLLTDTLAAEYFARELAGSLKAALLPAIPIGTSLEHTGFRGSFSFLPETYMAILRDIADGLMRQNFTRLIVVNGHGGNQAMRPAIRDINRRDLSLKIILVNTWECNTSEIGKELGKGELHAGASETSRLMAIRPDLVRTPAKQGEGGIRAAKQPDLDVAGFGTLRPDGVWGCPENASPKAGEEIVASIRVRMLEVVKERLEWLDKEASYGGRKTAIIQPMQEGNLASGQRLSELANWNQLPGDWKLFHNLNPEGCFCAYHHGEVIGTVTTVNYHNKVSWIAMVLVDPKMRRMGVGSKLMNAAIESLAGCESIKLDATPAGKKVYDRLGFVDEYDVKRLIAAELSELEAPGNVRSLKEADMDAVQALDTQAFGVDRRQVLEGFAKLGPEYAIVNTADGGKINGFLLGRHGRNHEQLGPIIAKDNDTAKALIQAAAARAAGKSVLIDVPACHQALLDYLAKLGFEEERFFTRMYKGTNPYPGKLELTFACSGPELG